MATFTWGTPTQIRNLVDPTSSGDAATKNYVDIKSIAGSNTQMLFNNAGNIGASANFTFNSATNLLTVTGNITTSNGNLGNVATANFFVGSGNNLSNIQASSITGQVANALVASTIYTNAQPNITSVGTLTSLAVTGNITSGNIYANSGTIGAMHLAGTLTTPAQPNITSVGVLTSLSISGNLLSNNIESNGNLKANALIVNDTIINGNLTVNGTTVYADVTSLNVKDPVIEQGGNPNGTALSSDDGKDRGQLLHYYTTQPVDAFMGWKNNNAEFTFASEAVLTTNNVTINKLGNLRAGNAIFSNTVTANFFVGSGNNLSNIQGANVSGQSPNSLVAGTVYTNAQPNITSVGTLTGLAVLANVTSGNVYANSGTVRGSFLIGSLVTGAQPNITSLGTITNLVAGNATIANLNLTGDLSAPNIATPGNLSVTKTATLGNVVVTGFTAVSGSVTGGSLGTAGTLSVTGNTTLSNLTTNGTITSTGNVSGGNVTTSGRINATNTITGGNVTTGGEISATGNVSAGNVSTTGSFTAIGNANVGNLGTSGIITATGNISGGNLTTAGRLSVTSNANVGNIGAVSGVFTGAISTGTTLSVTGNANVGNLGVSGLVSTTGNLSAGNISTSGSLSVTGNITLGSSGVLRSASTSVSVDASLFPNSNITYDLGSPTQRWKDLYLANSTIYLGNATLSATDANITMTGGINANGVISTGNFSVARNSNLGNVGNVTITGGSNGYVLGTDGVGNLSWIPASSPKGTNSQIQFNDEGSFAGNAGFTFNKVTGNLVATLLTGTLTSVAQPNITSIGTLTSLLVSGNITTANIISNGLANITDTANVGNLVTAGLVSATGNVSGGNITTVGVMTATGNISGGNITTVGNIVATSNISANNLTTTKNITAGGDLTSANITGSGFANITGNIITAGSMFANSGNIQGNNANITRTLAAGNITATGNITASGNISTADLSANGNVNLGTVANVHINGGTSGYFLSTNGSGTLSWASPSTAQGLNTEVQFNNAGSLTGSASFTFNKDTGVLNATQFNGSGAGLTSIPSANISGTVANANYSAYAGNVTIAAQSNITSLGTLGNLAVTNDANVGNINVSKLTNLGNIANVKITGGTDGYVIKTDGTGNLSWIVLPDTRPGGTTTEVQFNDGNVFAGNSAFTFVKATGKLTATHFSGSGGNLTSIPAANISGTIPANVLFSGTVANATTANVANYAGIVTGNTQSNITAVGTLKRLRVSNSGFNEVDSFAITGTTQAGYFSTTDTSFWIVSAPNAVAVTTGTIPTNPGSGFELSQDINQVTIINAGYQTVTVNPHGDFKPKTSSAGGSLSNNLGGKAGGTDYVYDIAGTPVGNIDYVTGTYWHITQDSSSGSGTGALFEVITVPAIGGIAYSVIVNDPGTGYVQGDTITILGANLGGATPANNLTFKVSQTWDAYWRNLYVGDVNMNNGTGNWTLMAGSDGLYLRNNSNGSKYKITMTSVPTGGPTPLG